MVYPKKSNSFIQIPFLRKKGAGFTLIELLVVITIIAILTLAGLTLYNNIRSKANDARIKSDINAIKKAYETNYDPTGQGGYKLLTLAMFASGSIPTQPNGSPYTCTVGPDPAPVGNTYGCVSAGVTQGFQVSATLSDGSTYTAYNNAGTLVTTASVPACPNYPTTGQSCKAWKEAVANPFGSATYYSTIYVNCSDIPSLMNCTLASGSWTVNNFYAQQFGGTAKPLSTTAQPKNLYYSANPDSAQIGVTVQLHTNSL